MARPAAAAPPPAAARSSTPRCRSRKPRSAGTILRAPLRLDGVRRRNASNVTRAAEHAGLSRRHFRELLYKHGIVERPSDDEEAATPGAATTRFGAYEILYELKSGGMGAVLLARRRGPGRVRAARRDQDDPPRATRPGSAVRAMFLDEARDPRAPQPPGHRAGPRLRRGRAATLYMVMEYVAGIPFRELIERRVPPAQVARAGDRRGAARPARRARARATSAATPLGVVHRDISPDNLMLGFDGHVKVIDFGIALVANRQAPVTEFGTVKGKPPYMSPEQVKNEAIDRRSDVFSLGVVLHEMLTAEPLFDGDSIYAIARAVEHASRSCRRRGGRRRCRSGSTRR